MTKLERWISPDMQKLVPILAILIEILWSFAWLIWLSGWPTFKWEAPPLNLVSCIILGVAVEILTRISYFQGWPLKRVRLVVLPASLLLLVILLRVNVNDGYAIWNASWINYAANHLSEIIIGFFYGLFLIWRGISVGRQKHDFSDLYRKFLIGLVGLIILFVIWGVSGTQIKNMWSAAGTYVLVYFGIGLLMLAIANLVNLRSKLLHHQETAGAFSRRWLSMLVILILLILGISGLFSMIFSSSGVQKIIHFLSLLGNWLLIALQYILLPVGYLLEGLIFVFRWLISILRNETPPPEFNPPDLSDLQKMASGESPVHIPEGILLALKWGGLALVIGLVIFFLARTLVRYWEGKNEDDVEEVHETIGSWSLIRTDLRAFLSWLFRWARRKKKVQSTEIVPPGAVLAGEGDNDKIFNIRELYQAFLWQGRQIGIPRRESETPYEYRQKMESRLDIPKEDIDVLTESYVADKYGLVNPTPVKVTLLNRVWRSLRSKMTNNQ
jgi:hypothetical protein